MSDDIIPLLKVHEYFRGMSDEVLREVAQHARITHHSAGEVVHEADHRALVDPQAAAQGALGHRPVGVDDREHLRVLGADPVACQRTLEAFGGMLCDEGGEIARPVGKRFGECRMGRVDR